MYYSISKGFQDAKMGNIYQGISALENPYMVEASFLDNFVSFYGR